MRRGKWREGGGVLGKLRVNLEWLLLNWELYSCIFCMHVGVALDNNNKGDVDIDLLVIKCLKEKCV